MQSFLSVNLSEVRVRVCGRISQTGLAACASGEDLWFAPDGECRAHCDHAPLRSRQEAQAAVKPRTAKGTPLDQTLEDFHKYYKVGAREGLFTERL